MADKLRVKNLVLGLVETNVYIVYNNDTKECLIIDPATEAQKIANKVDELGLTPKAILLTHGHFDHMMGAEELKSILNVQIYASENEKDFLKDAYTNGSESMGNKKTTLNADKYLKDNEELELLNNKIKVINTPGHTPGSCCYYIENEEMIFCGDTLFRSSYGRCDLPGGNEAKIVESIINKMFELPEGVVAYPGHMETTTIGYEKKYNPIAVYYRHLS